jgi:predicted DNA-binding transcriptional regulator AlpA
MNQHPPCYTILGFCADHHISRAFLYKLKKEGKAPKFFKVGRRTLITAEAAAEWRALMEAQTDQAVVEL